jgi:hypothetical protein
VVARGLLRRGAFSRFGCVAVLPSLRGKSIGISSLRCDGREADFRELSQSNGRGRLDRASRAENRRVEATVTHRPRRLPR